MEEIHRIKNKLQNTIIGGNRKGFGSRDARPELVNSLSDMAHEFVW